MTEEKAGLVIGSLKTFSTYSVPLWLTRVQLITALIQVFVGYTPEYLMSKICGGGGEVCTLYNIELLQEDLRICPT